MKRVTMLDIAKKAGVTKATVSLVLSGNKRISKDTKTKVLKIIKECNFIPNDSARKLALGRTNTIALIGPRFVGPFMSGVLSSLEEKAAGTEFSVQPYSTMHSIKFRDRIMGEILYARKADAVIMLTSAPPERYVKEYKRAGLPLILIENRMPGAHSITLDNRKASYEASRYLIKKYGVKAGYVSASMSWGADSEPNPTVMERFRGYKDALREEGVKFDEGMTAEAPDYSFENGIEAFKKIYGYEKKVKSIFCACGDVAAYGVMSAAVKNKIKIPAQLAVMGYDDIFPLSTAAEPGITTITQNFREIGRIAFDIAVNAAGGGYKRDVDIRLEPEIIARGSA